jgi:hypothetical protein
VSQDIRDWAAERGIELAAKGRIPNKVREQYEADLDGNAGGGEEPMLIVPDDGPEAPPEAPEPVPAPAAPVEERKPQKPPRARKSLLQRKPAEGPRKRWPRVSVENLISSGWALGAMALARNPNALPVARMLSYQSPIAGVIVDDMVKDTAVDRLLQPLARAGERGEKAVALIGPPLIVGMITAHPEWYPALKPMLKMSLMSWMTISGPAMEKVQRRAAQAGGPGEVTDAELESIIAGVFADLDVPVAHSEAEDAAVRRAQNSDG